MSNPYSMAYKVRWTKLKKMGFKSPEDSYESGLWKEVKNLARKKGKIKCEACGSEENINYHHWKYNNMDKLTLNGVVCLCGDCHEKVHELAKKGNISLKNATKLTKSYAFNIEDI